MNAIRTELEISEDLADVLRKIEALNWDESAEPLNQARKRYESELVACRIRARTEHLHPRIASIIASSPRYRPMLEAGDYGDPRDMSLEALPGYPTTRRPAPNSAEEYHEYELRQDAERDQRAAKEEACQE